MKIAIVGTGISGLTAAHYLEDGHDLTVFEARDRPGGHTLTHALHVGSRPYRVDMGFIVFNEENYPNFVRLLGRLGIPWQDSDMSFGVDDETSELSFSPSGPGGLFARPGNAFRPSFYAMLAEILRFRAALDEIGAETSEKLSLGDVLESRNFREDFVRDFIVPMGAAIWSCPPDEMKAFPARTFARFFCRHRFLDVKGQPRWQTVEGRSDRYVQAICAVLGERLRLSSPVRSIRRDDAGPTLVRDDGTTERFDAVILACHSDQSLALLEDATEAEREILGAIPYRANDVLLHDDESVLPKAKRARASWNYHLTKAAADGVVVTYDMNRLQRIDPPGRFLVTLNHGEAIPAERHLHRVSLAHPLFSVGGAAAQKRRAEIDGRRGTWFCGAYWGYGFHEDGCASAVDVVRALGVEIP